MSDPSATPNQILEVLSAVDEDGNDVFTADEIRHALPYLAFTLQLPLEELSEGMQALIADTLARAGGDATMAPDAALARIVAFYQAHPVSPAVVDAVRRALEGDTLERADGHRLAALGTTVSNRPVGSAPAPAGAVRGSLARLAGAPPPKKR